MALELRQDLKLSQQLIMTPQLQMAIKLLQLSRIELLETVQQELEQNPALEEVQEVTVEEPTADFEEPAPEEAYAENKEVVIEEKISDDIDWNNYLDEYNTPGRAHFESERKDSQSFEAFTANRESLHDHLLWQLLMTNPTEMEERIGSLIVGNLNKDGYLDVSVEELAETSGCPLEEVERVLAHMQTFDPVGVCARDLRESLLIQAGHYDLDDPVVTKIITHHLNHLENKNYKAIVKALKTSMKRVVSAANIIKSLEPRPGRQYSSEEPHYITPDIYVQKYEGNFVVMLNDDGMPKLRVNSFYKDAINNSKGTAGDAKDYIQDKLRSAAWLIR
ncbi:MAG: RNA polymerase sigma-54 factor, partial [Desulfobacterales bacterium]|nr:RNA polymerase sigma-54 factor [Desulfobacterales bacterium]